jgi:capsular polysaccharide biosynthesis protein
MYSNVVREGKVTKKRKRELEYEEDYFEDEDDGLEIDFIELLMMVKRHIKGILLITLLITGLGAGFAYTRPLQYKAETTLMVSSGNYFSVKNVDAAELRVNQELVSTYTEIAKSQGVLSSVIRKLDLDMSPGGLASSLQISSVKDTEIIKIAATNGNDLRATQIANETANEFITKAKEIMTFENIKVIEPAILPKSPLPRKQLLIVAVAFVLGVMVSMGLAIVVEMLHSKVRSPKDIKKILGTDILTHVPDYNEVSELERSHRYNYNKNRDSNKTKSLKESEVRGEGEK